MKVFIVNGQGGSGKALCNSTIIPTVNGWKKVEDIRIGDFLFDRLGKPTKVLGVFPQGEKEVFEIKFKDGRSARCSEDHLWNIHKQSWHREKSKNKFVPYSLKQIVNYGLKCSDKQGYRFSIQCSKAIEFEEKEYSIHPYVIGAFLGDGCCTQRPLTISSCDQEIVEKINCLIGNYGYQKVEGETYSWRFLSKPEVKNKNGITLKYFQTNIFFEKYQDEICQYSYHKKIPEEYKKGSINQRLQLLQGLFDTDGSIDKQGHITYTSESYQLILDIKEVLGSLGYVSTIHTDKRDKYTSGKCFFLNVNIDNKEKRKLFSLSRKKDIALKLPPSNWDYERTRIVEIKDLGYKEKMTCFLVDNEEHLFLINDFIVTHNTTFENFISEIAWEKDKIRIKKMSMIDMIKDIATSIGWDGSKDMRDRLFLSRLKDLLTEYNDSPYQVIKSRILMEQEDGTKVLFIDARERSDIERLVKDFNATTILVKRGEPVRYGNHADDNVFNYDYDIIVDNIDTIEDLKEKAVIFTNKYIVE